jgi:hypothetical protein
MTTRASRGLFRSSVILGIVGALMVATALSASAMIPKPGTERIEDGYIFTDLTGYQSPGGGTGCNAYAPNAAFSFSVSVKNRFNARDQAFDFEIYKMTQLDPATCYTEVQLENMVATGQNAAETLVGSGSTSSQHYDFDETHSVSAGGTETCGYFQFDLGLPDTGPFAPRAGYGGPPVSGFVLFNGPQCASGGTSGSGTSGATTTPSNSGAGAATLAGAGGGPVAPIGAALIGLAGISLIAAGVRIRRRSPSV